MPAGTARVRVRAERIAGTGTAWFTARLLGEAGLVTDELTLTTLTQLCGHLRLGRAARIAAADHVRLAQLTGINPLQSPADALAFLEAYRLSRLAGPTIIELDWLLRHRAAPAERALANQTTATFLTTCRQRLQTEESKLAATTENAIALTRQLLLELVWPRRLVDVVLDGEHLDRQLPNAHDVPLDALASTVVGVLPSGFDYSAAERRLRWSARPADVVGALATATTTLRARAEYTALPATQRDELDAALADLATSAADTAAELAALLDPLVALTQSLQLPVHQVSYASNAVPAATAIAIPPEWNGTFWYDPATATFAWRGPMLPVWRDAIAELGGTPAGSAYRQAVHDLATTANAFQETGSNVLVSRAATPAVAGAMTAEQLMGELSTSAERCLRLLGAIVPSIRLARATAIVEQLTADTFDLEPAQAAVLVTSLRHTDGPVTRPLIAADPLDGWLVAPDFVASDPTVGVTAESFPAQFRVVNRLSKLALLCARCALPPAQDRMAVRRLGRLDWHVRPRGASR